MTKYDKGGGVHRLRKLGRVAAGLTGSAGLRLTGSAGLRLTGSAGLRLPGSPAHRIGRFRLVEGGAVLRCSGSRAPGRPVRRVQGLGGWGRGA